MSTYSFLDTAAAIVGPGGVVDLAAGAGVAEEGISIEPSEDINTMTVGASGDGMHSLHANKSGRVVVRLLKTSPVNAKLSRMYALQTVSGALHGINTISVVNSASGDAHTCQQVAFQRKPTITYGKEGGTMEWTFSAVIIDSLLGTL